MPHEAEGEQVAKSFTKLWRLENRFTQMQIEISVSWDFLLLSAARGRDGWSKNPHHLKLHLLYCLDNSCLKQTASATHSFLVIPLFSASRRAIRSTFRSYSSFHKAAEGWKQLPRNTQVQLLQPSLSKDPNKLGSFSAVSQIDFPSDFLLPCHLHLPKSRAGSVTGCETHHILGWQLQGRWAHWEAQVSWGRHSSPVHFWYPASSCPAWHLPALPGCREGPRVCSTFLLPAQSSVGVSRRKQGVQSQLTINTQHCCCLTHTSEQERPQHDFHRRSAKVKILEEPPSNFRVKHWDCGWERFTISAQVPEKMFSKIYQIFAKIVASFQSMEANKASTPTEL